MTITLVDGGDAAGFGWGGESMTLEATVVDVSELFARHHLGLVRLAVLLLDDTVEAENVVQDAFIGLHRDAARIRDPEAAVGYLRRSTVNGTRSALRRGRTARVNLGVSEPEADQSADASMVLTAEHAHLLEMVRTLPDRDREVLALRCWWNLSEAEIADALGVSRETVRSTASRALAKLATLLEGTR